MISYPYENRFKEDSVRKDLVITDGTVTTSGTTYTVSGQTVLITNDILELESFGLSQALSTESQLTYGSCNAAKCEFVVHENLTTIKGKTLKVYMYVDGDASTMLQLGKLKVNEDKLSSDRTKRNVVMYDAMYDILNADVASWYKTLLPTSSSSTTLQAFRASFLSHFGITAESTTLINDSMTIKKTIEPETLSGADVIRAICEANGVFGMITNEGTFRFVELGAGIDDGLFPSDTLYPSDDLYPQDVNPSVTKVTKSQYTSVEFEDYISEAITQLTVRTDDEDIGVTVGTSGNRYVITNNFLLYGKNASELTTIASNILTKMVKRYYKPCIVNCIGNPCHEVGDPIRINTTYRGIVTYILERDLKGIQALTDVYTARGEEFYSENLNAVGTRFKQLENKTLKLKADVDGVSVELTEQLDQYNYGSYAWMTAQEIEAKVSSTDLLSELDEKFSSVSITANGFDFESTGSIIINTDNLTLDGNGNATFKGEISASTVSGSTISGSTLTSEGTDGTVNVTNGGISTSGGSGTTHISGGDVQVGSGSNRINIDANGIYKNGVTPYVFYSPASSPAWNAENLINTDNPGNEVTIANGSDAFIPNHSNTMSCGMSSRVWTDVYATNSTIQTSDERKKRNIKNLTETHLRFLRMITPRSFEFIDGESGRTHIGFIAQEVEDAMTECGLTSLDFAGFIKSPIYDEQTKQLVDYVYGLRYSEFIAIIVYAWQQTENKLDNLITSLEMKGVI